MSRPGAKIEIILPDGKCLDLTRRRRGMFRPYSADDGRKPGWTKRSPALARRDIPAERRRRRRGPGDIARGSIIDLES